MAGGDRREVHQSKKSSKQEDSIIKQGWFTTGFITSADVVNLKYSQTQI